MPFAVTHLIGTGIIVESTLKKLQQKYPKLKKQLDRKSILIGALGGIFPDIDFFIYGLLSIFGIHSEILMHGGITHTLLFGLIFIIPGMIVWKYKNKLYGNYLIIFGIGILIHVAFDYILGGGNAYGIMWFYPFIKQGYFLHLLQKIPLPHVFTGLDAIILYVWSTKQFLQKKLLSFI